jgi:hypothetical protein
MKIASLILAHDKPRQLEKLTEAVLAEDPGDVAIIHIDRRSSLWRERSGLALPVNARIVADPVEVRWGHWSQVAATHLLIREALASGCDAAHLVSGADWPIAPRDLVAAELAQGKCHVEAHCRLEERMQTYRLDTRWLQHQERGAVANQALWELRRLARFGDRIRRAIGHRRSQPYGKWLYGSSWWSLPRGALEVIETELGRLLASGRLHGTVCSDEHAIPTIIGHRFAGRLAPNRRFILWPEDVEISNPLTLRSEHCRQIEASDAWFARKFDAGVDDFFYALEPGFAAGTV